MGKSERKAVQSTIRFFFLGAGAATSVIISINFDLNVVSFNYDFVGPDSVEGRRSQCFAGFEVKISPVPGASDLEIAHLALGQWPAAVCAGIVNGVILSGDVEDGDSHALDVEGRRFARRQFFGLGYFD